LTGLLVEINWLQLKINKTQLILTLNNPIQILKSFANRAHKEVGEKLGSKTTISTLQSSLRRHESLIKTVSEKASQIVACKEGCSYCCSYCRVFVTPAEVFLLKQSLQQALSVEQLTRFISKLNEVVNYINSLNKHDFYNKNIDCIFLENNMCRVYDIRPLSCRNYHAQDVEGCFDTFNNPETDVDSAFVDDLFLAGHGFTNGVHKAYKMKGFDVTSYELHSALLEALTNTKSEKRWAKKKKAFLTAITEDSRIPTEVFKSVI